ncbi:hypothetical protein SRCM101060_00945 [Lactiplantibacillus plantarum]|nr:hypothetical protein SRCM101060_00945 [Lactiplantibacillus plantarum]
MKNIIKELYISTMFFTSFMLIIVFMLPLSVHATTINAQRADYQLAAHLTIDNCKKSLTHKQILKLLFMFPKVLITLQAGVSFCTPI